MTRQISEFQASLRALNTLGESGAKVEVDPLRGTVVTSGEVTIGVSAPIGNAPEVVVKTLQGEGRLPASVARTFVRDVQELAEKIVGEAGEELRKDLVALTRQASALFALPGIRVGGASGELRGYVERPEGPSSPWAVEWIQAIRNPSGPGDVLKGRLNGLTFVLEPGVNPWSGKSDLVLRASRSHPVERGRSLTDSVWGDEARQFFDVVKEAFKANRGIQANLQRPG